MTTESGYHLLIKEFSITKFKLKHDNCLDFYRCQWQKNNSISIYYVIYRILLALLFIITLILSIVDLDDVFKSGKLRLKWFIYLTNWNFTLCTVQIVFAAFLITNMYANIQRFGAYKQDSYISKLQCNIYWMLFTTTTTLSIFVCFIYWLFVYDATITKLSYVNVFTHAIHTWLLLVDCFIVSNPCNLMHFYFLYSIAAIYACFTFVYYMLGGTDTSDLPYIYKIMDWSQPGHALKNICFCAIFLTFLHIFLYCYVFLRKYLAGLYLGNDGDKIALDLKTITNGAYEKQNKSHISVIRII